MQHTKSAVTLKWTASVPAASLGSYQILDGNKVIKSVEPTTTIASLTFTSGTHKLSVRVAAKDALVIGGSKTSVAVTVTVDKTGPVVKIGAPAKPTKATSFSKVTGTATDAGSGSATVVVSVTEKKGSAFYFYNGSAWTKAASQAAAISKAKKISVAISGGKFSTAVKDFTAGALRIIDQGTDKLQGPAPSNAPPESPAE